MPTRLTTLTKPHKSTKNELKLLKYLGVSESDEVWVVIGDSSGHEISTYREDPEPTKTVLIPFSHLPYEKDPALRIEVLHDGMLFSYPNSSYGRNSRRIQAKNLKILLYDIEAHSKALEDAKLLSDKAEEEAALRIRLEYGELDTFNDRSA